MTERLVFKIGGATLFQPNAFEMEVRSLLSQYRHAQLWLLVGGGDLVEAMRTAHRIYPKLNPEEVHWRCVEILDHTWEIAKEIVPTKDSISSREDLEQASRSSHGSEVFWVRVQSFYNRTDCDWIPESWRPRSNWSTTTDALAWLLGKIIDADRVILLKQCECDPDWTLAEAAKRGVIDLELARLVHSNPGLRPTIELKRVAFSST